MTIGCCQNGDGAVLEWAGIGADRSNRSVVFGRHGKGNCLDNGPMESFFGYLKTELVLSLPFIPSIAETLEFCITTGYPFRHA